MKLALLHLSDIHFEDRTDWIFDKAEAIADSFLGGIFGEPDIEALFILISGDVANKGAAAQYDVAAQFLERIRTRIASERKIPVHFVVIPGNHDCDLSSPEELELRLLSIERILSEPGKVARGNQLYRECLKVQNNFFDFARKLEPALGYPAAEAPEVFYRLTVPVGERQQQIVFNCFNTAWLTQLREKQGALIMPRQLFPECENTTQEDGSSGSSTLSISLFHHPENWLSAENSNDFRRLLRSCSDIVVTGHEHEQDIYNQSDLETGVSLQIHRAGALQERERPRTSNFNVLLLDLETKRQKLNTFQWKGSTYSAKTEPEWIPFTRNENLTGKFKLKAGFEQKLHSLDTLPIVHARRSNLQIEDLFISPRLQVYSLENIIDGKPGTSGVESKDFFDFIKDKKKVLLYAETLQGKTITTRFLFLRLTALGVVPVLLDGASLTEVNLQPKIFSAFGDQYYGGTAEDFKQLGRSKRALIIDDFGQSGMNQAQLQKQLSNISEEFDYVIAVAHNNLRLQQFIKNENEEVRFSEFAHCEIKPFNLNQRSKLIQSWVKLANTSDSEDTVLRQISRNEQIVETACDSGIVAPFPAYILGILTLNESTNLTTDQTKYGTVGYLYDSLITSRFSIFDQKDIDLQQTYILLGEMAFHMFKNELSDISIEETQEIINRYQSEYLQSVYIDKFIRQITETGIILRNNGRLQFNSIQLRDFFVADYYSRAFGDQERAAEAYREVDRIIKTVTYETHTRILLFLVFKANDKPRFIEQILNVSRIIFAGFTATDLESDVEFLNELKEANVPKPKLVKECSVWERRAQLNGADDEDEDEEVSVFRDRENFLVEYREDLSEFTKAAITLKMIEVLGQLARSFASTLKGEVKIDIISETVDLGLRFLKSRYLFRTEDIEELRSIVAQLIKHKHPELNSAELLKRADQLLLFSYFGITFGVIKKISVSIGHEDLKGSFDKFFASHGGSGLSYRMVEAAFRLDHYPDPLIDRIIKLGDELKDKNKFVWDVLRNFVAQYMNLSSVSNAPERQKLIEKFNLADNSRYLINSEQAERKYLPKARKRYALPESVTRKRKK